MGAAMSYATGDSGAMEALGVGSALSKGSESLFANSMRTLAKDKRESGETWEESKIDLEKNNRDRAIIEAANAAMGEGQTKYTFQNLQKHMTEYLKAKKVLENPDATQEQKDKANAHIEKLRKDGVLDAFEKRSKFLEHPSRFGAQGVLHDDRADLGVEQTGKKELVSDLTKRFQIGKRQIAVIRGVDLGCLGENGAIALVKASIRMNSIR